MVTVFQLLQYHRAHLQLWTVLWQHHVPAWWVSGMPGEHAQLLRPTDTPNTLPQHQTGILRQRRISGWALLPLGKTAGAAAQDLP